MNPKLLFFYGFSAFLCLHFSIPSFSQAGDEIDSLKRALERHPRKDTTYMNTLMELARKTRRQSFDESVAYFEQAIELSKDLSDPYRQMRAHNGLGITHGMSDNYPEAIRNFNTALKIALQHNFLDDAGTSYGSLGIVYKRMGEYPTSLSYYTKSLEIYDSLRNEEAIASTYSNLGVLADLMKEPDKAMDYYERALQWYGENANETDIAKLRVNIGIIHIGKQEYQKALEVFHSVLDFFEKQGDAFGIANTKANMGWTYFKAGHYRQAEPPLLQALDIAEQHQLRQLQTSVLYTLAKTKAELGEKQISIELASRAAGLTDSLGSLRGRADARELLSFVHRKAGNLEKALDYYREFSVLEDSIFNETKSKIYKNQQVIMEVHEKDKQLEAQTLQMSFLSQKINLENRWKWTLGVASFFLLVAGALYFQKYQQGRKYSEELESKNALISHQKKEIEEVNLQLEKRMLRAQMNPHFIFNALSSIQHFIIINDKVSALRYLSHFSSMLRQILENSVSVNMALKDEVELIKIYLELESLRFENDFTYAVEVDENLDVEMLEIPTMIVQPFVENAILHGLMPKDGERHLNVDIRDNGQFIRCTITDNGIGRKASAQLNENKTGKSKSRGISVTEQRLKLLENNYGLKTDIQYVDLTDAEGRPSGTQVIINIPKQEL